MQFRGEQLHRILISQTNPVNFCDASGVVLATLPNPKESIAELASSSGYTLEEFHAYLQSGFYGVGSKRRIRYIQATSPNVWGAGWRGGSRTTRPLRADASCGRYTEGQLMGSPRALREHIPSPGPVQRPKFASCPPAALADQDITGLAECLRLSRTPDGAPLNAKPAPAGLFPLVPTNKPIGDLNGPPSPELRSARRNKAH